MDRVVMMNDGQSCYASKGTTPQFRNQIYKGSKWEYLKLLAKYLKKTHAILSNMGWYFITKRIFLAYKYHSYRKRILDGMR